MPRNKQYLGKYRGTVINTIDPERIGRIQVLVPDVSNVMLSSWAMPCLAVGGRQMGMFTVPPLGAAVWVEFERGDPAHPIWVGCYWRTPAEVPALAALTPPNVPGITFQTVQQNGIVLNDVPGPMGGIVLKSATGATLIVNDTGIYIQNGKGASIEMLGNTITLNHGALVVD